VEEGGVEMGRTQLEDDEDDEASRIWTRRRSKDVDRGRAGGIRMLEEGGGRRYVEGKEGREGGEMEVEGGGGRGTEHPLLQR